MAKNEMFYVDRHTDPLNPELIKADDHQLMRVYENKDDLITDIDNIEDNEVVAAQGNDYEGIEVVDEVTEGNQNPATSNAVYNAIEAAKIDRVKGAFVEERTNKLWTDGRPIYRMYVEGSPTYTTSGDRRLFNLDIPMGTSDSYCPLSYEGYFEIAQNTSYPQLVGTKYTLSSTTMTPTTPWSSAMTCILQADIRYQNKLNIGLAFNSATTYGASEQIKICAVIEYTKMSDEPVSISGSGLSSSSDNVAGIIVRPGISYSTTEVPTGDTWIDGKPVYRAVVDTPWMTTYTETNQMRAYIHSIANLGIGNIISASGMVSFHIVRDPTNIGTLVFGLPVFITTGAAVGFTSWSTTTEIYIAEYSRWGGGLVDCKATVTIEYTKA